jgi:hypothetical protein
MHYLSVFTRQQAAAAVGDKAFLYATAPGVALHELSHAVMCLVFGHRISELKLFSPSSDGTLGYVNHSYNRRNLYHVIGNFFIGTAPIWGGALAISLAAYLLLGPAGLMQVPGAERSGLALSSLDGATAFLSRFLDAMVHFLTHAPYTAWSRDWRFYLFLYLAFSIGCHVTLSPPDISSGIAGFGVLAVVVLVANLATLWFTRLLPDAAHQFALLSGTFLSLLLVVLVLNFFLALAAALFAQLRSALLPR